MRQSGLTTLLIAASLVFLPLSAAFGQLSSGLLNYWNFEGNYDDTAGTVAGSSSTAADNGTTPAGGVTIQPAGLLGQYGNFPGAGAYVNVANSNDVIAAGESLALSVWFRVTAFDRSWQCLIAHGEGSDYRIARRGDETVMAYAGGAGDIGGGPVVNDGQWHHVVAISEAAVSTRIWVDGALVATGAAANLTNNGAPQMMIGGNPDDAGNLYRSWNGDIDDVGMWSRPLSDIEISNIYNAGRAGTPLAGLFDNSDSDGDGLPNVWETLYGLNPGSPTGNDGANGDPDGDGLTNAQEFNTHHTNPSSADTDSDALSDGAEVSTHLTNPLVADTDGDALGDGAEVNTHHTNPLLADTDGDGYKDGVEVAGGFSPIDPNSHPTTPISLGVGTAALLGGDLTDPENDGNPESDLNYNAIFLSSEEPGFGGGESAFNVFDNVVGGGNDKWCCGDGPFPYWIQATFEQPVLLTHFTVSSANDTPERDPRVWEIQGSNDGVNFTTIFRQNDPAAALWTQRLEVLRFNSGTHFTPPALYSTLRFTCFATGLTSGAKYQVGEIEFFGTTDVRPFDFTQINYNKLTNEWTLSWTSKPARTYRLNYSTDLVDFANDIDDSIPSGGATTTFTFPNPIPLTGARVQFKVTEN